MASTSTRLCRAVCFCVVSFASGFLCFFLLFGCSLGGFVLPDAAQADSAWAFFCCFGCSELAVFCFLVLVVCLASLRPLKKSAVQKKIIPSSTITPPSSTITLTKKYQVFLSFRGPDTRFGFTSHLYHALSRKCMVTFIDYKLARGDEISPALMKSIQESMIAVVIFSKDYASSKWCLRELAEIMKCKKLHGLIVLPVFYNVDPSDVRKQTGPFKDSFAKHENESQKEVLEWREAFTEASNLSGWDSAGTRSEAELVRDIVEDVWRKLVSEIEYISISSDFEGLIGIHKRIEQVMSLLCLDSTDVRSIGIWGMGGIGKTTLAEVVFNKILGQFDGSCFIKVGERLENKESNCLRLEVLREVLDEKNLKLVTPTILHPFIKQRLTQKKVLIVFDAVNKFSRPLETLVNDLNRCHLGSRIIITSRDKQVLYNYKVLDCNIYEVEELNFYEALILFSNYAFNQNHPTEDFMDLSVRMVRYTKGNPLALRVSGSHLLGKDKQEWESAFDDLQGIGDSQIFKVLKMSYDGLNEKEKDLFLDIACFNYYFGWKVGLLEYCKYSLSVLVTKSLITIGNGTIEMHDLLREMGREIVRRESPKNPGKRSRLWKHNDVIWTLKNNKGTETVEGIFLQKNVHLNLSRRVFDNMPNLKLLLSFSLNEFKGHNKLHVHLPNGLNSLPDELMILEWPKYPLRALPSKFSPKKLVVLDLSYSNIEQLWEETEDMDAPKLKWLILEGCHRLIRIPNLTDCLSLEKLDLTDCWSLVEFPSSVQHLNKLRYLSLRGFSDFSEYRKVEFPLTSVSIERLNLSGTAIEEVPLSIQSLTKLRWLDLSRCRRLKHIPASILKLKSLHTLHLDGCSKLETFLEISETMEILNDLVSSGTAITDLCSSIEHLNGLQFLNLRNCKNLEMLPSSICDLTSLKNLDLSYCSKLDRLPDNLGNLKSLKKLIFRGTAVCQLPSSITCLENLEVLSCSDCSFIKFMTILPTLSSLCSLSGLYLQRCNLMEIPEHIGCLSSLEQLYLDGNMFESLPKSIKHLSKLETLSLRDCDMLRSLKDLPVALKNLVAINCKQLCQALPDASEFKRCITSKYHKYVNFLFTNSFNLDQKAVGNVFEESLKGSEEEPTQFCIYLTGSEIPEWFTYQSSGSSINIPVLRQDLINRKIMGFAICAVIGVDFNEYDHQCDYDCRAVYIRWHFETFYGSSKCFPSDYKDDDDLACIYDKTFNTLDHILLQYYSFSEFDSLVQNRGKIMASDNDYMDISFEIKTLCEYCKVKHYAVHPIYAEPKEIIGATIEDIGETSGRRSGRSDDNEEEVEPHPKRFCTQPKLMLPISNQNP